jgi:hypothetical protein
MSMFQVITICAWCPPESRPKTKPEDADKLVSHSICEDCFDREMSNIDEDEADDASV